MSHDHRDHHHAGGPDAHHHGSSWSPAELAGFLSAMTAAPRQAVDLGCGTGADAVFLAQQGIETTGVDLSSTALDQARERGERHDARVEWLEGDVLQLPLDDASMDLALDRGCLHHVAAADQRRYAAEVARVLRPGGILLVREMNQPGHHEHAISETALRDMIEGMPLRVRSIVTYETTGGDRSHRTMLAAIERT